MSKPHNLSENVSKVNIMTVAPSCWAAREGGQVSSTGRSKSKAAVASAGTGLQVVAVLFAVRIGYKLARTGTDIGRSSIVIMAMLHWACVTNAD